MIPEIVCLILTIVLTALMLIDISRKKDSSRKEAEKEKPLRLNDAMPCTSGGGFYAKARIDLNVGNAPTKIEYYGDVYVYDDKNLCACTSLTEMWYLCVEPTNRHHRFFRLIVSTI